MSKLLFLFLILLSSFEMNAQYHLKAIHSRINIFIDTNQNNRLIMHLNLLEGIPDDSFYIQQSFKDNPSFLTTRAKGKFFRGILTDSLIVYNNRGQVIEKGFFRNIFSNNEGGPDKLDSVNGFGKYGLVGIRNGKFTYYSSGKKYTNHRKESEIEYKNGLLHGKNIHFHVDGTIHTSDTYFRGTLNGEHLIKYSDGITEEIGYYKMGKKDSLWMNYYPNGQLKVKSNFKNGMQIGENQYYDSLGNEKTINSSSNHGNIISSVPEKDAEFVPLFLNYQPTELNIPFKLKKKQIKLLKKAENSLFELGILNKKVDRVEFLRASYELSNKEKEKILRFLMENITTPGIFYNQSYYGGTVTFQIEKVHLHTKDWIPTENR